MIIGAGPYGISLAYDLWDRGVPFEIAGKPFDLWMNHTMPSMAIRSDRHTSEIYTRRGVFDLTAYIRKVRPDDAEQVIKDRLPSDLFRDYLRHVLKTLPFSIENQKVETLKKENGYYISRLEDGSIIHSEEVVLASGIEPHKQVPAALEGYTRVQHGWETASYSGSNGKKLLVIGGGQSAAEAVDELSDHNEVTWMMKRTPTFYSEPINLPKPIFKLILLLSPYFYFLPSRLKKQLGRQFVETTITPDMQPVMEKENVTMICADAEELKLEERSSGVYSHLLRQEFDQIIAATGYTYDVDHLRFVDPFLRGQIKTEGGIPEINFDFESSVSGLYFAGGITEPFYGPAQRFMMGSRHVTSRLGSVLS